MNGIVPSLGLRWKYLDRKGRFIEIPKITGTVMRIKTLKEKCINVEGSKLFNSLPKILRNFDGKFLEFKKLFDNWMNSIPDCPVLPGYSTHNLDNNNLMSNSLIDWNRNLMNTDWEPDGNTTDSVNPT